MQNTNYGVWQLHSTGERQSLSKWRQTVEIREEDWVVNKTGKVGISITSWHVYVTNLPWKSNKWYYFWICGVSVALVIQQALRMLRIKFSCGPSGCTIYIFFSPHFVIETIFGRMLLNIKCVFWYPLQLLSETFLILRKIQQDIVTNVHRSFRKVPVVLVRF